MCDEYQKKVPLSPLGACGLALPLPPPPTHLVNPLISECISNELEPWEDQSHKDQVKNCCV